MAGGLHFITVGFPGVRRWLENGAAEGLWGLTLLEDQQRAEVPPAEAYGVGAWHMAYVPVYEQVRSMGVPFGVAWSSSPQESDTNRGQIELLYLLALTSKPKDPTMPMTPSTGPTPRPDWWACLDQNLAAVLPNAIHLPGPIHLETLPDRTKEDWIGFFVPPTEKKAIFSQLLAVRAFQRTHPSCRLQTNLAPYQQVMDWLGLNYTLHPWLPRDEYLEVVGKCRVVLHASIAEAFGYGAVDALMAGTPVMGSPTLPWLPPQWCVVNPNDPTGIAATLEAMYGPGYYVADPREFVAAKARINNSAARVAVEAILTHKAQVE